MCSPLSTSSTEPDLLSSLGHKGTEALPGGGGHLGSGTYVSFPRRPPSTKCKLTPQGGQRSSVIRSTPRRRDHDQVPARALRGNWRTDRPPVASIILVGPP